MIYVNTYTTKGSIFQSVSGAYSKNGYIWAPCCPNTLDWRDNKTSNSYAEEIRHKVMMRCNSKLARKGRRVIGRFSRPPIGWLVVGTGGVCPGHRLLTSLLSRDGTQWQKCGNQMAFIDPNKTKMQKYKNQRYKTKKVGTKYTLIH